MARPKKYDAALRRSLIDRAAEAIASGGVAALSLREVATAAGTSTNAVYTIFGSKDDLVAAVAEEAARSFTSAQRAAGPTGDPLTDLAALGVAYRAWAQEHPALYAVMFGGRVGKDSDSAGDESMAPLLEAVDRARAAGVLRHDVDPMLIATSVWAGIHGLVSLEIAGHLAAGPPAEHLADAHLDAIIAHWLAPGARPRR